jgi:hypothetical protein
MEPDMYRANLNTHPDEYDATFGAADPLLRLARRLHSERQKAARAAGKVAEILVKASNLPNEDRERFVDLACDCFVAMKVAELRSLGPDLLAAQTRYDREALLGDRVQGAAVPVEAL